MSHVICPNCSNRFLLEKTYSDEAGLHTKCPQCGSLFYTDKEVELSDRQLERNDEIYDAVFSLCKVLVEDENLEWNIAFIGEITDFAVKIMVSQGYKVRFPAIVTEQDGSQYIEEFNK